MTEPNAEAQTKSALPDAATTASKLALRAPKDWFRSRTRLQLRGRPRGRSHALRVLAAIVGSLLIQAALLYRLFMPVDPTGLRDLPDIAALEFAEEEIHLDLDLLPPPPPPPPQDTGPAAPAAAAEPAPAAAAEAAAEATAATPPAATQPVSAFAAVRPLSASSEAASASASALAVDAMPQPTAPISLPSISELSPAAATAEEAAEEIGAVLDAASGESPEPVAPPMRVLAPETVDVKVSSSPINPLLPQSKASVAISLPAQRPDLRAASDPQPLARPTLEQPSPLTATAPSIRAIPQAVRTLQIERTQPAAARIAVQRPAAISGVAVPTIAAVAEPNGEVESASAAANASMPGTAVGTAMSPAAGSEFGARSDVQSGAAGDIDWGKAASGAAQGQIADSTLMGQRQTGFKQFNNPFAQEFAGRLSNLRLRDPSLYRDVLAFLRKHQSSEYTSALVQQEYDILHSAGPDYSIDIGIWIDRHFEDLRALCRTEWQDESAHVRALLCELN